MRIFIAGPVGGGKTTFARRLSHQLGIASYALDDLHWRRDPAGDQRRPMDEKQALLAALVAQEAWILEGVQFKWLDSAFARADLILVLEPPVFRNLRQILTRFIKQVGGRESANYKPTIGLLVQMLRWNADYRTTERALLLEKLQPFLSKTSLIKHPREGLALVKHRAECIG